MFLWYFAKLVYRAIIIIEDRSKLDSYESTPSILATAAN